MKTTDDFKTAVSQRNIKRWDTHDCAICGMPVGYVFIDGNVYFDGNCDCSSYPTDLQHRLWQNVADMYLMNTHNREWLAAANQFWGWIDD